MADKLLLSISGTRISAARWRNKSVDTCVTFETDEDGLVRFRHYLAQMPRMPVHIMVNAVEEDWRIESLPHTLPIGTDRKNLVHRKLQQFYRNTAYSTALLIGRDDSKRRDDRYLFYALTNPDIVKPWIDAVLALDLPLAGVHPLPTLGETLLKKLEIKATNLLLVSAHNAGLRLSYFRNQQLRTSRLAHINRNHVQPAQQYAAEISNTRLYLHTLRVMSIDDPLVVLIVDRDDSQKDLIKILAHDAPNLECRRITPSALVKHIGITAETLAAAPATLYLHLLGLRVPTLNLAPAQATVGFRQHQLRNALYVASGAVALGLAAWSLVNAGLIWRTHDDTEDALRETTQLQAQYQDITRTFPQAPTTAENLQRTVEIAHQLNDSLRSHTPETMMLAVSKTLDDETSITLKSLAWKYGGENAGAARVESGVLEGEVRPFRGDYRAAIEAINHFADALAKQPQVAHVDVTKLPLNINPSLTLSGNTNDSADTQTGTAAFTLIFTLKPTT